MREIGIMGGAFNPPHFGHMQMAQCALEQYHLEKVIFMPSGTPPHKKDDLLDKELRYQLIATAVRASGNSRFFVSRLETDRPGISWTIDTLRQLRRLYGSGVRFNFIMGDDNIQSLTRYDRRAELLCACRVLVAPRGNSNDGLEQWQKALPEAGKNSIAAIDCPTNALSGTLVRKYIRSGRSLAYLVPPAVIQMIEQKGLYKSLPSSTGYRRYRCRRCKHKLARNN